ncbi:hypothetical protein GQ42DRAFT_161543 [Ramicandelaber brevisporus]|nr:hypothetical protein GQ42DRAFT_161543 [Ramicandelaber brevisporus]
MTASSSTDAGYQKQLENIQQVVDTVIARMTFSPGNVWSRVKTVSMDPAKLVLVWTTAAEDFSAMTALLDEGMLAYLTDMVTSLLLIVSELNTVGPKHVSTTIALSALDLHRIKPGDAVRMEATIDHVSSPFLQTTCTFKTAGDKHHHAVAAGTHTKFVIGASRL